MARGVLSGIGLGAVFSLAVAGAISVLVPMQPQPAPQLGTAEPISQPAAPSRQPAVTVTRETGGQNTQPQVSLRAPVSEVLPTEPDAAAQAPQVETDLDGTQTSTVPRVDPVTLSAPEEVETATAPAPLTSVELPEATDIQMEPAPVPQPRTGPAADLTVSRPLPADVTPRIEQDAPVLPNPQALAPMIPHNSAAAPSIAQSPPNAPEPTMPEETPTTEAPMAKVTPAQEPEDELVVQALKPRILPAPATAEAEQDSDTRPRIGTPANTLVTVQPDPEVEPAEEDAQEPDAGPLPPVRRYARDFENADNKPLMSIVLIDSGVDQDEASVGLPALSSFPYPVSFAVPASLPDAAERMARYRAEGFEVLAIVDLPEGARPSDAEVSLSVALDKMSQVVGVMEGTGAGLQGTRDVADQVTGILRASGHGLVTQSKGLNSMPKLAVKEGVPAAAVFRDFDSEGQQARVIRRFLDQAAFKAGQQGGVIMLGRLRPETIEALVVWGLADRAGSVALAPVSAVLLAAR